MSRHLLGTSVAVAALVSLSAAGCQRSTPPQPAAQGAAAPAPKKPSNLKTLTLTHPGAAKVVVGTATIRSRALVVVLTMKLLK